MSSNIEHSYTPEIVCPHCGHEHSDSMERPGEGTLDCESCRKSFEFWRIVDISYSTIEVSSLLTDEEPNEPTP